MKTQSFLLILLLSFCSLSAHEIKLKVDAAVSIAKSNPLFNGTNIEDINNQTNGVPYLLQSRCCTGTRPSNRDAPVRYPD